MVHDDDLDNPITERIRMRDFPPALRAARKTQLAARCEQCGTVAPLTGSEYGPLCQLCAYRQAEHDERRELGLSARAQGFLSETD